MVAVLGWIREFVMSLVLAWVGVAVEPTPPHRDAVCRDAGGSALVCSSRPGFDSSRCADER